MTRRYFRRRENIETCLGTLAIFGLAVVGSVLPMI
jgi:hypothetical protein